MRIVQAMIWGGRNLKRKEETTMTNGNGTNGNGTHAKREVVEFPPNTPVTLAVKYAEPKIGMRPGGDDYAMFTTVDNRVMFLDCEDARKITELHIRPGQQFCMMQRWSGKKGDPKIYQCWIPEGVAQQPAPPPIGAQPDGTFAVPSAPAPPTPSRLEQQLAASVVAINNKKAQAAGGATAQASHQPTLPQDSSDAALKAAATKWGEYLLLQAEALIDVYAGALKYASELYGNSIKPEDVRCLLTTAYINVSKNGGAR